MPIDDDAADWIWCRDVLVHADLARGFAECARILRPGGEMLAYVTCSTDLLEPREAERLFAAIAVVPESTQPAAIERHAAAAGLTLVSRTELGGEWREQMIEEGTWDPREGLLRLSRLRRRLDELTGLEVLQIIVGNGGNVKDDGGREKSEGDQSFVSLRWNV